MSDSCEALQRFCLAVHRQFGSWPRGMRIDCWDVKIIPTIPAPPPPAEGPAEITCSEDGYRLRHPRLGTFAFRGKQAAVVRRLADALEDGSFDVDESDLLSAADSSSDRLVDVFKNRKDGAYGKVIVRGDTQGTFRLAPAGSWE
jgi:hypothetical protein